MNARPQPPNSTPVGDAGNSARNGDAPGGVAPPARIAQTALYLEVAERLRQSIFAHELAPGDWVDEQALAADYGISRTPLREALKVLATEGLVTLKPRRGCYVTEVSEQDLDDIFPLMAMLEGRSAWEAARKCQPEDLARLEEIHARLESYAAANQVDLFFEANQDFHRLIQELSGNRWLLQLAQDLRKVLKLTRMYSLTVDGRLQQAMAEHQVIMAALRQRDADAAEAAMRDHLLAGRKALARPLGARPPAA
ncbi:GntR family transcriptional regulator [Rhodocyclus tenuis]|uniref:DNA-binding GntR family transcriptional regulator n=1 Tax=Rhodocyclus tenuis TaxID=1066 RepID=A0A840FWE1_RHOTE|nr:GntR family transcriptional regulator [Rhodocyclus tenuis]MBB4246407.1 DNA-binding GntR family transcriptional regulator [Rhodocyclus tenuis]MBK1681660.1 GntR family transcriptional regulator [Rhodocyclus tenuis]